MITKFENYKLIKETPDSLSVSGREYYYYSGDARPFFVDVNSNHTKVKKLYVGDLKKTHGDISAYNVYKAYAGRLWEDIKVISFWVYPNENLFVDIIKNLENELNIKIFNNGWRVEVVKKDDEIVRQEFDENEYNDYYFGVRGGNNPHGEVLIPVEEYAGSENPSEELRIQHMLNWKEKAKLKKDVDGFGSDKTGWDKPHNIKYRQTIHQEHKEQ